MTNEILKITLVQTDLIWENPQENLKALEEFLTALPNDTDVVVLPEMFTTGFSMNAENISSTWTSENKILHWLQQKARQYNAAFTGTIPVRDKNHFYNRLLWVEPDGNCQFYDKRHTFSFAGEDKVYSKGDNKLLIHWRGWRICPLICYDLRFPVWSRNRINNDTADYDLLIYVANWPSVRNYPWRQLLIARSIENVSYVAGCNRIGTDANGHEYSGHSMVIDFKGAIITQPSENISTLLTATCDFKELQNFRNKFPALRDSDTFRIE